MTGALRVAQAVCRGCSAKANQFQSERADAQHDTHDGEEHHGDGDIPQQGLVPQAEIVLKAACIKDGD